MMRTWVEYLEWEWRGQNEIWQQKSPTLQDKVDDIIVVANYFDIMTDMRDHPLLYMAKLAVLALQGKNVDEMIGDPHPYIEVLKNNWTCVFIEGVDPQTQLDTFDWLFERAKMNVEWIRYYSYGNGGQFVGCEYYFKDPGLAMLFKLTWA